jgi:hypothetical protein
MLPELPYLDDIRLARPPREPIPETDLKTGYICAIIEWPEPSNVYIGIVHDIHIKKILQSLQKGNPRKLRILRAFNRADYRDARAIGLFLRNSLILNQEFGNWYSISPQQINRMFDEMFDTI